MEKRCQKRHHTFGIRNDRSKNSLEIPTEQKNVEDELEQLWRPLTIIQEDQPTQERVAPLTCNSEFKRQIMVELRTVSFNTKRDNASERSTMRAMSKKEFRRTSGMAGKLINGSVVDIYGHL